jgi:ubiquitin carboxyl-terminal hydrolase 8
MLSIEKEQNQDSLEEFVLSSTDKDVRETQSKLSSSKDQNSTHTSQTDALFHQSVSCLKSSDDNDIDLSGNTAADITSRSANNSNTNGQQKNILKIFWKRITRSPSTNTKREKITSMKKLTHKKQASHKLVSKRFALFKNRVDSLTTEIEMTKISSRSKYNNILISFIIFYCIKEQPASTQSKDEKDKSILFMITNKNIDSLEQKNSRKRTDTRLSSCIPGVCGLINVGNTCFMNSALQCLSSIPRLTRWANVQKQYSSTPTKTIIHAYVSLIQSMWSGKNTFINPYEIKELVSRSAPIFSDYGQKDSHEFMNSLLNALHTANPTSGIIELFHICTQSQVICGGCEDIDLADEVTTFLPLPLPREVLDDKEILLDDLIDDYCREDNLDGFYYCHSCQKYNKARQKTSIDLPLPPVLIIQLKRFPFDGTNKKIDTFVRYKLQHFNLLSKDDKYELCAVSSHVGNLAGGHYTALAKNFENKQWYHFNDTHVDKINSRSVISRNAYILVYLKQETAYDGASL